MKWKTSAKRNIAAVLAVLCCLLAGPGVYAEQPPGRVYDDLGTTTALANTATFTSSWVDVQQYNSIVVTGASDTKYTYTVTFSPDMVNPDSVLTHYYDPAKINPPQRFTVTRQYVRISVTNISGTDMSFLRVQVLAGEKEVLNFPADDVLPQRADATAVRVDDYKIDIGLGRREGAENIRKFATNSDVDTGATETVWAHDGRWQRLTTARILNFVSTSANDTLAGTGLRSVIIIGVGADGSYQEEFLNLNGLTPVPTVNTWLAVNRVAAIASGSLRGNEGTVTGTAAVDLTVQAIVPATASITNQAFFTVPTGRQYMLTGLLLNARKLSGGATPFVTLFLYYHRPATNTVFQVFRMEIDTGVQNTIFIPTPHPYPIGPGDTIEAAVVTDTNNTSVTVNFWGTELQDP